MKPEIIVDELKKVYYIPVREHGLIASLKSLVNPIYNDTVAVDKISFNINKGEIVGFIGPNGAGKTTTLKMLSGLLYPTSGNVTVAGFTPSERKPEYLRKISLIMGNKGQLNWDITIMDSLYIIKEIYHLSEKDFTKRLDELVELLEIEELLPKLARNLSLGERAKCEFAAALLYGPDILFLDEPTLGMDVSIQIKLRNFIKDYCKRNNTTVIVTSHYMADITSLCSRVILINKGQLIYDGDLTQLAQKLVPFKMIKITSSESNITQEYKNKILKIIQGAGTIIEEDNRDYVIRVKKEQVSQVASSLLTNISLADFTVEDPPIEVVIDQVYREGV